MDFVSRHHKAGKNVHCILYTDRMALVYIANQYTKFHHSGRNSKLEKLLATEIAMKFSSCLPNLA